MNESRNLNIDVTDMTSQEREKELIVVSDILTRMSEIKHEPVTTTDSIEELPVDIRILSWETF